MTKRDYFNIIVLSLLFLLVVNLITDDIYLYGSTLDWNNQHYNFADYFRLLFYETKDILPDFAFNIGGGQNIYNFSYYGLLNPIFLISYFLPFISMQTYLMYAMLVVVILSIGLLYYFIRKKYNTNTAFITSVIFLSAVPLTFHSHRHIMFMSYMPFLILSLIGVDRYFDKNKKGLLIVSLFMLIMTSYYFSIGSIFAVVLYGLFRYIKDKRKGFIKEGFKFIYPIFISVLMSLVLTLPTFYAILNGRSDTTVSIDILKLFIPNLNFYALLYDPYTMGLSAVSLIFLISSLFREKEYKFLGISILLVVLFPVFSYILNAMMYVEHKVLIPLIPLVMLLVGEGIYNIDKIDYKKVNIISIIILIINYFYIENYMLSLGIIMVLLCLNLYKLRKMILPLIFYIVLSSYFILLTSNLTDKLYLKDVEENFKEVDSLIEYLEDYDKSFYRVSVLVDVHKNLNRINNLNNYSLNVYSSVSNGIFNELVFDTFNHPIAYRNRAIINSGNNYFYNNYMGVKYIISKKQLSSDYELIKSINGIKLYKNEKAYSLGYVTSNVISISDYDKLKYPYTVEALMNGVVTNKDTTFDDYKIKEYSFDIKDYILENIHIEKIDDKYIVKSNGGKLTLNLKEEINNKLVIIRFNNNDSNSCDNGDTKITINGISNKLTCKEWKYHNNNYQFDYVLANDFNALEIKFTKGTYDISNIEIYIVSKDDLVKNNLGEYEVDKSKTKGDNIYGNINVKEDGYFVLNIPYDKGFNIFVDNKKVDYEMVNEGVIGFKISEGNHNIKIEYNSPFKDISLILSIIGFCLFIIEVRRCKNG